MVKYALVVSAGISNCRELSETKYASIKASILILKLVMSSFSR